MRRTHEVERDQNQAAVKAHVKGRSNGFLPTHNTMNTRSAAVTLTKLSDQSSNMHPFAESRSRETGRRLLRFEVPQSWGVTQRNCCSFTTMGWRVVLAGTPNHQSGDKPTPMKPCKPTCWDVCRLVPHWAHQALPGDCRVLQEGEFHRTPRNEYGGVWPAQTALNLTRQRNVYLESWFRPRTPAAENWALGTGRAEKKERGGSSIESQHNKPSSSQDTFWGGAESQDQDC
mmetsp:Transcript_8593/g.25756  ORF Transcript_8593/g.25756 Transcript_8593/m.25756 type:complete len:230 (-) Transcript_8593:1769-2458(-)